MQLSAAMAAMAEPGWIMCCMCAAWCGTCRDYQIKFDELAAMHPTLQFVWIDIEDQADVVGDLDVDDFPTVLIQRGDLVAFFGTVQPDLRQADRLLLAQMEQDEPQLQATARQGDTHRRWQRECNLLHLINAARPKD
ncbi:MAG: thioredoxin family protein [Pseudomonadota bacterium]